MARQAKPDWTLSRRSILQWLGALGVGSAYGLVGGCSDDSSAGALGKRDAGDAGDASDAGAEAASTAVDGAAATEAGDASRGAT